MLAIEKVAIVIIVQAGHSPFLWGGPGKGKSSLIRLSFEQLGYRVKVVRVNTILPHHLGGSPIADVTTKTVTHVPPDWVLEYNKSGKLWILFLDDISAAGPANQLAALGVMDEHQIAGVPLNCVTIGAANFNSIATARFAVDAAITNRCIHVPITSDPKSFQADIEADFPAPLVPSFRDNWREGVKRHRLRIAAFLNSPEGKDLLHAEPEEITDKTVAWPSERSWMNCADLLAAYDAIDPDSMIGIDLPATKRLLFKGAVGEGAYKAFINHFLKPMEGDAARALKEGRSYVFPKNGDQLFGLFGAIVQKLQSDGLNERNWGQSWGLIECLESDGHLDRGLTFVQELLSINGGKLRPPAIYEKKLRGLMAAPKKQ